MQIVQKYEQIHHQVLQKNSNNYFCKIGKALAEKIKPYNLHNFQQYLM